MWKLIVDSFNAQQIRFIHQMPDLRNEWLLYIPSHKM